MSKSDNPWHLALQMAPYLRSALLWSELPGTGKTTFGLTLARAKGINPVVITVSDTMTTADLVGHWIPQGKGFAWHDGAVARGIRAAEQGPAMIVLNELARGGPDVHDMCHWLVDQADAAQTMLPNGETLHVNRNLIVIATQNPDPEESLPRAVRDRFQLTFAIGDHISPIILDALPPPLASMVADHRIGSREAFALLDLQRDGCPPLLAIRAVLGADRAENYGDALAIALS